jgi:hypothetical protein
MLTKPEERRVQRVPGQHLQYRKRQQHTCGMQHLPIILHVADWQVSETYQQNLYAAN